MDAISDGGWVWLTVAVLAIVITILVVAIVRAVMLVAFGGLGSALGDAGAAEDAAEAGGGPKPLEPAGMIEAELVAVVVNPDDSESAVLSRPRPR